MAATKFSCCFFWHFNIRPRWFPAHHRDRLVYLYNYLSIYLRFLSIYLSFYLLTGSNYWAIDILSIHILSVCLSVCLIIDLSIHPSNFKYYSHKKQHYKYTLSLRKVDSATERLRHEQRIPKIFLLSSKGGSEGQVCRGSLHGGRRILVWCQEGNTGRRQQKSGDGHLRGVAGRP